MPGMCMLILATIHEHEYFALSYSEAIYMCLACEKRTA